MPVARDPAVAGSFYPAGRAALERAVEGHLAAARTAQAHGPSLELSAPGILIAPHAGYRYSGPVAGSAFSILAGSGRPPGRVVVLGPSHYASIDGLALSGADAFETPLGRVPVDRGAEDRLRRLPRVATLPEVHAPEHAIEVELPFLQRVLGSFELVPILVGEAEPPEVAEALEEVLRPDDLLVVSSDLSHFLDYGAARARDRATAGRIERGETVGPPEACGWAALNGLALWLRERGLPALRLLDLRSSGDTAGPRSGVVGYGAFAAGSAG